MASPKLDTGIVANPNASYKRRVRRAITPHEEIRRRFGFGVVELATAAGFSHTYVSLVEAGRLKPSARYRAAVAKVLDVPEELIFEPAVDNGSGDPRKDTPAAG